MVYKPVETDLPSVGTSTISSTTTSLTTSLIGTSDISVQTFGHQISSLLLDISTSTVGTCQCQETTSVSTTLMNTTSSADATAYALIVTFYWTYL